MKSKNQAIEELEHEIVQWKRFFTETELLARGGQYCYDIMTTCEEKNKNIAVPPYHPIERHRVLNGLYIKLEELKRLF